MRELQTAELWLVTGGQTAPSGGGTTTTTTTTNTNTNNQGVTGNLTFGPGGQPTGGSVGYTWTSGSTSSTTTTTTTTTPAGSDPRDTTPREPLPQPTQQQEVPGDLEGLY